MPGARRFGCPRQDLSIHLRALGAREVLREVGAAVAGMPGRVQVTDRRAFRPAPPQPEERELYVWQVRLAVGLRQPVSISPQARHHSK